MKSDSGSTLSPWVADFTMPSFSPLTRDETADVCIVGAGKIDGGAEPLIVTTVGPSVRTRAIVVATNTPVNDRVVLHTKQAAYRTYVLGFRVRKDSLPIGLDWDNNHPYHYIRLQQTSEIIGAGFDRLIVGGEDHKTGQMENVDTPYSNLKRWVQEHFPMAGEIDFRWSGQVLEPVDGLAFIGKNPLDENVYICTGDSGNGMTHGTIAGILLSMLINGQETEWEKLYDPRRRTLLAGGSFCQREPECSGSVH